MACVGLYHALCRCVRVVCMPCGVDAMWILCVVCILFCVCACVMCAVCGVVCVCAMYICISIYRKTI